MSEKVISIIGAGRVGKAIGRLIKLKKAGILGGVFSQTRSHAEIACAFIEEGIPCDYLSEIPQSDIIFITTPDSKIKHVCDQFITENTNQKMDHVSILHCSGSLTTEVLDEAKSKLHALIGSIHPIHSFGNPALAVDNFSGTICSYQGDGKLYTEIKSLFTQLGAGKVFRLSSKNKALYHVSGMFPGCLTTALMKISKKLYLQAGVPESIVDLIIPKLLANTVKRIHSEGIDGVNFDGPLARKDTETFGKHLEALKNNIYKDLYLQLMLTLSDEINDNHLSEQVEKILEKKRAGMPSLHFPNLEG